MRSSYAKRLANAALPYVLFYLLLCSIGGWDLPLGWLLPLPVLVIALFRVFPRSRYELRELEKRDGKVLLRYADYDTERSVIVPASQLKVDMKRDPSTIYRRYILDIEGPNTQIHQYERGKWNEAMMKEVLRELSPSPPANADVLGSDL